jgi:hypothetical protein
LSKQRYLGFRLATQKKQENTLFYTRTRKTLLASGEVGQPKRTSFSLKKKSSCTSQKKSNSFITNTKKCL